MCYNSFLFALSGRREGHAHPPSRCVRPMGSRDSSGAHAKGERFVQRCCAAAGLGLQVLARERSVTPERLRRGWRSPPPWEATAAASTAVGAVESLQRAAWEQSSWGGMGVLGIGFCVGQQAQRRHGCVVWGGEFVDACCRIVHGSETRKQSLFFVFYVTLVYRKIARM